jgi:hypothetical protein
MARPSKNFGAESMLNDFLNRSDLPLLSLEISLAGRQRQEDKGNS